MPNFQGSVNQVLGTIGALDAISGAAAERREVKRLDKRIEAYEGAESAIARLPGVQQEGTAASNQLQEVGKERLEAMKKRFELDPTEEGARDLIQERSGILQEPLVRIPADPDEIRAEQAMAEAEAKQEAMRKNMERRRQHIMNMRTSLGGRVGDFKEPLRSMVIDEYMKQEGDSNG